MKTKLLLIAVLVLFVSAWTLRPVAYEYKFEHAPSEKKVNQLSTEGWELVLIESAGAGRIVPTYVFKRAK